MSLTRRFSFLTLFCSLLAAPIVGAQDVTTGATSTGMAYASVFVGDDGEQPNCFRLGKVSLSDYADGSSPIYHNLGGFGDYSGGTTGTVYESVGQPTYATYSVAAIPARRPGDSEAQPEPMPLSPIGPNHAELRKHTRTSRSMTGTSLRTPTTVASAAPDESPKSITDVAIATSKWFEAPIRADGAASR